MRSSPTIHADLVCRNVGFRLVLERAVPETNGKLPEIVFAWYQM